jgi:hypothetical protein
MFKNCIFQCLPAFCWTIHMPVIPFWMGVVLVSLLVVWLGWRFLHRGRKRYSSDQQHWWMD